MAFAPAERLHGLALTSFPWLAELAEICALAASQPHMLLLVRSRTAKRRPDADLRACGPLMAQTTLAASPRSV